MRHIGVILRKLGLLKITFYLVISSEGAFTYLETKTISIKY
jgi:hypothetical protein